MSLFILQCLLSSVQNFCDPFPAAPYYLDHYTRTVSEWTAILFPRYRITSTTTLGQFQSGLKTMLFRLAYGTWLGAFVTVWAVRLAPYKLTYLLTYLLTCYSRCYCGNQSGSVCLLCSLPAIPFLLPCKTLISVSVSSEKKITNDEC